MMNRKTFIRRRFGLGETDETYIEIIRANKKAILELEEIVEEQNQVIYRYSTLTQANHRLIELQHKDLTEAYDKIDELNSVIREHMKPSWAFRRCLRIIINTILRRPI